MNKLPNKNKTIIKEYVKVPKYMKKNIFFIIIFIVLNGCAQYSSIVGPTYTMAKTGNLMLTGASVATSYGIKKTTGYTPGEHINSLVKNNSSLNGRGKLQRVSNNPLFIFK